MTRSGAGHRLGGVAVLSVLTLLAVVGLDDADAWAHVTVHPSSLPAGSSDVEITFRVPNERDNADTTSVQVFFPTNLPLLTVDVLPVPGWIDTVHTRNLAIPVQTDDGPVSQVVSDVTWTATAGGISQGQYEDFPVAAGAVPDHSGPLVFKALQTYSSGEVVRWIEVPVTGQPEPDTPAPVLTLTAPTGASGSATAPVASGSGATSDTLSIVALVLSVVSLLGVGWLVRRGHRRA